MGWRGGPGLGSKEAEAVSEAELRHCITANHELSLETRGKLGNLLSADFLFREKKISAAIISAPMTAVSCCSAIPS